MATEKKYLDLTGLGLYNTKIKDWVSANFNKYDDTALAGRVTDLETLTNNYSTVASNAANGQTAYTALAAFLGNVTADAAPTLAQIDNVFKTITINGKRLISDSYANNEVVLSGADIAVSGTDSTKLSTKISNMDSTISGKADKATTLAGYNIEDAYTKTEVDGKIAGVKVTVNGDEDNTYVNVGASVDTAGRVVTLTVDESKLSTKISNMDSTISGKADKATTLAGYNIEDAYTKTEVDGKIATINAAISGGTKFIGVINDSAALTAAAPDSGDIFVAGAEFTHSGLTFKKDIEYIFDGTNWYELGDSSANAQAISNLDANKADKATTLAGYNIGDAYTKTEVDGIKTNLQTYADTAEADAIAASKKYVDDLKIATTYATKDELNNGLAGKTSMSVVADGVVFSQGSGDTGITVSPITNTEIEALFA